MGDVDLPLVAVREQVASAIDMVVHLARKADGARRVVAVAEVEPDLGPGSPLRVRALARDGKVVDLPRQRCGRRRPRRHASGSSREPGPRARPHGHGGVRRVVSRGRRSPFGQRSAQPAPAGASPAVAARSVPLRLAGGARSARPSARIGRSGAPGLARRRRPARPAPAHRCGRPCVTAPHPHPTHPSVRIWRPSSRRSIGVSRSRGRWTGSKAARRRRRARSSTGLCVWPARSAVRRRGCSMPPRPRCTSGRHWRAKCGPCRPRPRASALVMIAAPIVFALGAVQVDSRVGAFFTSGPGALCVLAGLALDLAGAWWMARIVRAGT